MPEKVEAVGCRPQKAMPGGTAQRGRMGSLDNPVTATVGSNDEAAAARRMAFVTVGRELFLAHGYADTTMSSISQRVGGSKTTLWNYFPSKEELFAAVVDDIIGNHGKVLEAELSPDQPVESVLRQFGYLLLETIMSHQMLALYRLVVGEAERFPHLAQLFFERGPRAGKSKLADWISSKMASGELKLGDPLIAAKQFGALCQVGAYYDAVLGLDTDLGANRLGDDVDRAVETFCRAWAPVAT